MSEAPRHRDDQGHMDRPEDLKRLLLPTRDAAVASVCPPPDHSQSVEVYRCGPASARDVTQSDALSSPETLDRSRLETSAERGKEAVTIPHAVQERHDNRGIEPWELSEGSGTPGQKDHGPSELHFPPWSIPTALRFVDG